MKNSLLSLEGCLDTYNKIHVSDEDSADLDKVASTASRNQKLRPVRFILTKGPKFTPLTNKGNDVF